MRMVRVPPAPRTAVTLEGGAWPCAAAAARGDP